MLYTEFITKGRIQYPFHSISYFSHLIRNFILYTEFITKWRTEPGTLARNTIKNEKIECKGFRRWRHRKKCWPLKHKVFWIFSLRGRGARLQDLRGASDMCILEGKFGWCLPTQTLIYRVFWWHSEISTKYTDIFVMV